MFRFRRASLTDVDDSLVAFDPIRDDVEVGPVVLTILRPRSAEELIDEDDYARDERLPYWADLWPSGIVLAERLSARPLAGTRAVELGCGVGVPAIVAALGGADVLATDWYPEALAFTRANAAAAGARVETMAVDWRQPPAALLAREPGRPRHRRRPPLRGAQRRRPRRPPAPAAPPGGRGPDRRPAAAPRRRAARAPPRRRLGPRARGRPLRRPPRRVGRRRPPAPARRPREPDAISGLAAGWATLVRERSSVAQW